MKYLEYFLLSTIPGFDAGYICSTSKYLINIIQLKRTAKNRIFYIRKQIEVKENYRTLIKTKNCKATKYFFTYLLLVITHFCSINLIILKTN